MKKPMTATAHQHRDRNVVIYCRVGTAVVAYAEDSIAGQVSKCKTFIEAQGLMLMHEPFFDIGFTVGERPGFNAMLDFLSGNPEVGTIVVTSLDRLTRRVDDIEALAAEGVHPRVVENAFANTASFN